MDQPLLRLSINEGIYAAIRFGCLVCVVVEHRSDQGTLGKRLRGEHTVFAGVNAGVHDPLHAVYSPVGYVGTVGKIAQGAEGIGASAGERGVSRQDDGCLFHGDFIEIGRAHV